MNKEITIYELLGLIKDGQAPEVIRYKQLIYCKEFDGYYTSNELKLKLSIMNDLNDKVEIIEEYNKIRKIKKLNNVGDSKDLGEFKDKQQLNNHILKDKINKLIDEINALKEQK